MNSTLITDYNVGLNNLWSLNPSGIEQGFLSYTNALYNPGPGLPPSPAVGESYISTATANGWIINHIYVYTGTTYLWKDIPPLTGELTWIGSLTDMRVFDGTNWIPLSGLINDYMYQLVGAVANRVPTFVDARHLQMSTSSIDALGNMTGLTSLSLLSGANELKLTPGDPSIIAFAVPPAPPTSFLRLGSVNTGITGAFNITEVIGNALALGNCQFTITKSFGVPLDIFSAGYDMGLASNYIQLSGGQKITSFSTDGTFNGGAAVNTALPTQLAVQTYVKKYNTIHSVYQLSAPFLLPVGQITLGNCAISYQYNANILVDTGGGIIVIRLPAGYPYVGVYRVSIQLRIILAGALGTDYPFICDFYNLTGGIALRQVGMNIAGAPPMPWSFNASWELKLTSGIDYGFVITNSIGIPAQATTPSYVTVTQILAD